MGPRDHQAAHGDGGEVGPRVEGGRFLVRVLGVRPAELGVPEHLGDEGPALHGIGAEGREVVLEPHLPLQGVLLGHRQPWLRHRGHECTVLLHQIRVLRLHGLRVFGPEARHAVDEDRGGERLGVLVGQPDEVDGPVRPADRVHLLEPEVLSQSLEVRTDRGQAPVGLLAHGARAAHAPRVEVDEGQLLLERAIHGPQGLVRQPPRVREGHEHRPLAAHLVVDADAVQLRGERAVGEAGGGARRRLRLGGLRGAGRDPREGEKGQPGGNESHRTPPTVRAAPHLNP